MKSISEKLEQALNSPRIQRYRKARFLADLGVRGFVAAGGLGVILAITLIFFYLVYEVMPLFGSADIQPGAVHGLSLPEGARASLLLAEEQNQLATLLLDDGTLMFVDLVTGQQQQRALPLGSSRITAVSRPHDGGAELVLGLDDGRVLPVLLEFPVRFDAQGERLGIEPQVLYPWGETPRALLPGQAIRQLHHQQQGDRLHLAVLGQEHLQLVDLVRPPLGVPGPVQLQQTEAAYPLLPDTRWLLLSPGRQFVYLATPGGRLQVLDARKTGELKLHQQLQVTQTGIRLTDMIFQLGSQSLLLGDSHGQIQQGFLVRDERDVPRMTIIRSLSLGAKPISQLVPEARRKGLVAVDSAGRLGVFNTTAANRVLDRPLFSQAPDQLALSPRADQLLALAGGQLQVFRLHNPHPEVTLASLWQRVWYEGYDEPDWVWQSSSASNAFEPKFSLTPLAFGTLKAAFYALLLSIPLALCAAIYTAHFMAPALRRKIKPVIELMEALPTVVLGFFAGLFLAPFMEQYLPGIFALLVLLPPGLLLFGYLWFRLPENWRYRVPDGWHAVLLLPVVLGLSALALSLSQPLEIQLFGGDMRNWLTNEMGIAYDQRNALVVGLAMGFAVIPTIYSIAEDALFGVPSSLSHASLALGATPWQTVMWVILPTASPGIFSAVMIGTGRAVGETMIVLMATGNTPVMSGNPFEGMRTLAANIAVEMSESAVGSTHYRILFVAALVLFVFTFVVNTLAELVRQRLRHKYSRL